MGVTHELLAKIASYHGLPKVTSVHVNTTTERSLQYISKLMGVTHELPAKIASYQGLPKVTSEIKKI